MHFCGSSRYTWPIDGPCVWSQALSLSFPCSVALHSNSQKTLEISFFGKSNWPQRISLPFRIDLSLAELFLFHLWNYWIDKYLLFAKINIPFRKIRLQDLGLICWFEVFHIIGIQYINWSFNDLIHLWVFFFTFLSVVWVLFGFLSLTHKIIFISIFISVVLAKLFLAIVRLYLLLESGQFILVVNDLKIVLVKIILF